MQVNIRKGNPADIEAALDLVKELAVYEKAAGEVEVTVQEMRNWAFGDDKLFDFFVAEKQGEVIGMALYYYKYSTWKGKCIFLEDIVVRESERCRGYGGLLFEAVRQVAREQKVKRLEWQVLAWNEPAIGFYKKYKAAFDNEWLNCKLTFDQLQF